MDVSLETLRRAVTLVDSLAEFEDPAGFARIVLPGLAALMHCDVLAYSVIGPAPGETRHQIAVGLPGPDGEVIGIALRRARREFTDEDRAVLSVLRAPLTTALLRARQRHQPERSVSRAALADLTGREAEVLRLAAAGATNAAIAHALTVSPRTVAKHLEHAYRKLGVSNRAAAVAQMAASPAGF